MQNHSALIRNLQKAPNNIRNISVIAHVDHGKTSVSDSLIYSNGLISLKNVGKIHLLDSRQDEQERYITMKSSAISLFYKSRENVPFLVNLIDSPGHIDFSFEVSAALRLTDGALLVVDVVEGVCPQTITVMRQAWEERIKMVLILNKVDRLCIDLCLNPMEAYDKLKKVLNDVNVVISSLMKAEYMKEVPLFSKDENIEKLEKIYFFDPANGNVVFASAFDCWGFSIDSFALFGAKKLGLNEQEFKQKLWGNYYFNPKDKTMTNTPVFKNHKPMFVSLILESIWREYEKAKKVGDTITYNRGQVRDVLYTKMPIDEAIFLAIATKLPSPVEAQKLKVSLLCSRILNKEIIDGFTKCSTEAPVLAYISKMYPIEYVKHDEKGVFKVKSFVSFGRIFSGILHKGDKIFIIGPKHGIKGHTDIHSVQATEIGIYMGASFEETDCVYAGNIIGIKNLEEYIMKTATISTIEQCGSMSTMNFISKPIIKVAIHPLMLKDTEAMIKGLEKINKSDPSVEIYLSHKGEHIIAACGEVHLEKSIKDLQDDYAKIQVKVSQPIVSIRETLNNQRIIKSEEKSPLTKGDLYINKLLKIKDKPTGFAEAKISHYDIRIRAFALPYEATQWLESHKAEAKAFNLGGVDQKKSLESIKYINEFIQLLQKLKVQKKIINLIGGYLTCFGPKRSGSNLLILPFDKITEGVGFKLGLEFKPDEETKIQSYMKHPIGPDLTKVLISGFDLAIRNSPICEENMMGTVFYVDKADYEESKAEENLSFVITNISDLYKQAFINAEPRLVEPIYLCTLQLEMDMIGKIYGVIIKRRGKIIKEELLSEANLMQVQVHLPVIDSFGFPQELANKGSGESYPQLIFSHWNLIEEDPFEISKTQEQLEEFGYQVQAPNIARQIVTRVRTQKGLSTEIKVVAAPEKERNLSKNK